MKLLRAFRPHSQLPHDVAGLVLTACAASQMASTNMRHALHPWIFARDLFVTVATAAWADVHRKVPS